MKGVNKASAFRKMLRPFLLFAVLVCSIDGYPSGAPITTCSSLTPVHSGAEVQQSPSPYEISVYKISGNKVRVKIASRIGENFRGFMLQTRSARDNKIIEGKFSQTDRVTKTINCFSGIENTLTHTNRDEKREIETEFHLVGNLDEDVIFTATVVKTYFMFWTFNSAKQRMTSQSASLPSQSQQKHDTSSIYHNCFTEKGCFGLPKGCVTSMECDVLLSYTNTGSRISFTLNGKLEKEFYMAMGLSLDDKMGEDLVTACYRKDSIIEAEESYNRGKRNFPNTGRLSRRYNGAYENGLATCSFLANYRLEAEDGTIFDLENKTYHLLLAHGPYDTTNKRLGFHSKMLSSAEKVNFTNFESISAAGADNSIKIHGTFMLTAWIGFASIAILMARHFKTAFNETKLCKVHVWFAIHRLFMASAIIFILIALITIFVYKGGWNFATSNPHAYFGLASSIFAVIQPIMAAFRPAPDDQKKRPIFNWAHFSCGNLAYVLAIITMFLAVSLETSGLKSSFYYVLTIFIVVYVLFHVMFQVHTIRTLKSKANNEVKMLDMSRAPARSNTMQNNATEKKANADIYRILLLALYSIFVTIILVTMYSLIGVA